MVLLNMNLNFKLYSQVGLPLKLNLRSSSAVGIPFYRTEALIHSTKKITTFVVIVSNTFHYKISII